MSRNKSQNAPANKLWDLFAGDTLKKIAGTTILEGSREQIEDAFRKMLKGYIEKLSAAGYQGDRLAITVLKGLRRFEKLNVFGNGLGALVTGVVHALDDKVADPRAKALLTGTGIVGSAMLNSLDAIPEANWDQLVDKYVLEASASGTAKPAAPKPKALTFAFDRTDGCLHLLVLDDALDPVKDKDGFLVPACPAQQKFVRDKPDHPKGLVPVSYENGLRMRSATCPFCDEEAKRLHEESLARLAAAAAPKAEEHGHDAGAHEAKALDKDVIALAIAYKATADLGYADEADAKGPAEKLRVLIREVKAHGYVDEAKNLPVEVAHKLLADGLAITDGRLSKKDFVCMTAAIQAFASGKQNVPNAIALGGLNLGELVTTMFVGDGDKPKAKDRSKETLDAMLKAQQETDPAKRGDALLKAARVARGL